MATHNHLIEDFIHYKGTDLKADLEKLHTKQLMNMKNDFRTYYDYLYDSPLIEALNGVLSTREHIPNKMEAKKIRQDKAKQKQNR